jgi:hypothetical protein
MVDQFFQDGLYWTKNSDVPMSSFACSIIMSHLCMFDKRGGFKDSKGGVGSTA